jgi:hypothetical protein
MQTLVIIASGPSLTRDDCSRVEGSGCDIMGISNAFQICGGLNYLYSCDRDWWSKYHDDIPSGPLLYSLEETPFDNVTQLVNGGHDGLSVDYPIVRTGGNSGYQAINLAVLLGYRRLILLGYDMQLTGGKTHWHGSHPYMNNPRATTLNRWAAAYDSLAPVLEFIGVTVLNATRKTALTCFSRVPLEEVL